MDYTVIWEKELSQLIQAVNQYLTAGWIPQGGVAVTSLGDYNRQQYYFQALIKE